MTAFIIPTSGVSLSACFTGPFDSKTPFMTWTDRGTCVRKAMSDLPFSPFQIDFLVACPQQKIWFYQHLSAWECFTQAAASFGLDAKLQGGDHMYLDGADIKTVIRYVTAIPSLRFAFRRTRTDQLQFQDEGTFMVEHHTGHFVWHAGLVGSREQLTDLCTGQTLKLAYHVINLPPRRKRKRKQHQTN